MPATDILNPTMGWDQNLGDSMNPSFGFTRKRATTLLHKKPVGGTPWSRETQNTGHIFSLSWLGRSLAVALKLKWYYEQYENGFFTFIDWDGSFGLAGRHYVGRFTSEVTPVETANNRWDGQSFTFEEMPILGMVQFPSDWDHEAVTFYPFDDFGDQQLAPYSTGLVPGWSANARLIQGVPVTTLDNPGAGGNLNDWACYEYRGYGFKLFLMSGPEFGQCTVSLDGTAVGGTIDCYMAADSGPQMVLMQQNVPLDFHRVQVNVSAAKNALATAPTISWHSLQVMR